MIDKIEAKIAEYINGILSQKALTHEDYITLTSELCRLNAKEREAELAANNKEQQKMWLETLNNMIASKAF